jgi:hypothetical protein
VHRDAAAERRVTPTTFKIRQVPRRTPLTAADVSKLNKLIFPPEAVTSARRPT